MNNGAGIFTNTLQWLTHPSYSDESLGTWGSFLMLVLILSFLWSTVIKQIE
jgi:hypothetical protein